MTASVALPASGVTAVLQQVVATAPEVLGGTAVAVALLRDGVLHFVTAPLPPSARTWADMAGQLDPAAAAGPAPAPADGGELVVGLRVGAAVCGFLIARRATPFSPTEEALLRLAGQRVAGAVENGRLRSRLLDLLDEYMSPDVARTLLEEGAGSQLGGRTVDVSVLFADLRGFTALAEQLSPPATVALLNRYFALAAPAIVENGGTVSAFIGDAVMGLFGAPLPQPEHPLLAARAALALQRAVAEMVAGDPDLPRFRIGVATGPATVGSIGSARRRAFTAIGDTVNLASRLETSAAPGSVVISAQTHATIRALARTRPLPPLVVKGKRDPVAAYELLGLDEGGERRLLGSRTLVISLDALAGAADEPPAPR